MLRPLLLAALTLATFPAMAQNPPFPAPADQFPGPDAGKYLQRSMSLMATSTAGKKRRVRVLFYGQSITNGPWTNEISKYFREKFPNADFDIRNLSIGGFSSQVLIRPAEHDVYPFYPDLVIFHVYGSHTDYERIIKSIRSRTTAEVLIHNDHYVGSQNWSEWFSRTWTPTVAGRYGAEFADVRTPWRKYLQDNKLEPSALLSDAVHPNAHGNFLLAELLKPFLRHAPGLATDVPSSVRDIAIGRDVKWNNGRLKLEFEGNRVDLVASTGAAPNARPLQVLIDGRKPSTFPELYAFTRPSGTPHIGWPAIIRVDSKKPLLEEEWTARLYDIAPDASKWKFEIIGSKTGPDGSGTSDKDFVSKSGRVAIEAQNWWLKNDFDLSKKPMPATYEVKWRVVPQHVDSYLAPKIDDPTREYPTTLAQGLSNDRHTLELIADGAPPSLESVRVYRPPVK